LYDCTVFISRKIRYTFSVEDSPDSGEHRKDESMVKGRLDNAMGQIEVKPDVIASYAGSEDSGEDTSASEEGGDAGEDTSASEEDGDAVDV